MVAPRQRRAHLGPPHASAGPRRLPPAGRAPWALAALTGLRRAQPAGAAHSRRTGSQLGVSGAIAGGDRGPGAAASASPRGPRPGWGAHSPQTRPGCRWKRQGKEAEPRE
uniref:uncharacterized protein LOC118151503 n=1 Tax=Callithrix jacchus TaxID=9483 RepID=UPI0023DCF08E|nr:uncharacterized protein LOC118151503 [Callithrix jacchus]